MKIILLLSLIVHCLFAFGEDLQSFEANFVQTITDETGKVLTYKGSMHTKRPSFVLWDYKEPSRAAKKLYMNQTRAVLVQPMLEQATITPINENMNFFDILASAKAVDLTHYEARYKKINFILEERDGIIISLSYQDELENKIIITFTKQRQNHLIQDSLFIPKVPVDYDIIRN
ncbi:outer-membrane lipoprotein carrier protein LolA [Sulfurimonas sp. MAG313]|nr:LolA-like outer membrane lipoprotein chaperone [Sulfurimonas sp. MAG313]MDF1881229.1 outer-membrane lipoprotein carrier protein LolA [Sulfurimonas sp. MAG313]